MISALLFFIFLSPLTTLSLNQEGLYLQRFTKTLDDPDQFFSTWNSRYDTPCNWTGVFCNPSTGSVTALNFTSANLGGPFSPILCRLQSLNFISFANNSITSIPSDISTCQNLTHLDLSQNLLTGNLPDSLSSLPSLEYLDLSGNNFSGNIPRSFGNFPKLRVISLTDNLLDGDFPTVLFNVVTLTTLNVSYNPFNPSRLGPELGKLINLECFWAMNASLSGELPDSFTGMKSLVTFDVSNNQLTGRLPSSLTELTSAVQIELYGNDFVGELPTGWAKMTSLRNFDASMNRLNGTIPDELTQLQLASLNMYQNQLEGVIPESIADSPNLYELKLFDNRLSGELPSRLGLNSPLNLIDVTGNNLSGKIPPNLCSKGELTDLLLLSNSFSGDIPATYSECNSLTRIRLSKNKLTGNVPFWGLPHVSLLELSFNLFSGEISKSIASASNLSQLLISNNNFSGKIPDEIGLLDSLLSFMANDNKFSGSLPDSMLNLDQLGRLNLMNNELSGEIPAGIKSMKKLNELNLANNKISGQIPSDIGLLSSLNYLDLSNNQLSGSVPDELQNLNLNQLNLSNNRLSGQLPPLFAKEMYKSSFLGNPGLCGDIQGLCDGPSEVKKQKYLWLLRTIFVLAAVIFFVGVVWFYYKYKNFKQVKRTIDKSKWTLMSFHKLGFSEYEILDCLDEDNVIGTGASGKVYKAVLSNGEAVAVKKLWSPSTKIFGEGGDIESGQGGGGVQDNGFEAEVETLGKIRHKNIVRLWCCCKTKDCKLLVYEYMPNGSLGDLLHSPKGGLLDWPTRYRIALDAAEGLSYLHHDCVPAIVHRDVKSNNILLDGEYGAKMADFGVAKVVDAIGKGTKSMSVIAGSCGYIAPEYAYTLRVNEKSDTYSFGVVILELVTGKRPVDPEYGEKDLVKWVCTTMDQKGVDHVIDPKLDTCFKEEICKLLNIGLLCTSPLPINRPSMRRVVKMLEEVSGENVSKSGKRDGKLTPYYYEDASDQGSVA